MHRNADGACLVGNGPGNGLTNPPGGIGGELEALAVVKLLHGLNQAQVSLLNQVQEQHAPAHVPLGNGNHQAEVGFAELFLGFLIPGFQPLGNLDFLLGGQQGNLADLLEVHAYRIINADPFGYGEIVLHLFGGFRCGGLGLGLGIQLVDHFHSQRFQSFQNFVKLVGIHVHLHQSVHDLLIGQLSLAFSQLVQFIELGLTVIRRIRQV